MYVCVCVWVGVGVCRKMLFKEKSSKYFSLNTTAVALDSESSVHDENEFRPFFLETEDKKLKISIRSV